MAWQVYGCDVDDVIAASKQSWVIRIAHAVAEVHVQFSFDNDVLWRQGSREIFSCVEMGGIYNHSTFPKMAFNFPYKNGLAEEKI